LGDHQVTELIIWILLWRAGGLGQEIRPQERQNGQPCSAPKGRSG
jgi:hypothetical protein